MLAPASLAYGHDHERPELKAWFQNLKSKSGAACCDDGEAEHAEAVWDMAKGGYKVFLKNPANPEESGEMVRRACACRRRTTKPQWRCDGVVVSIL